MSMVTRRGFLGGLSGVAAFFGLKHKPVIPETTILGLEPGDTVGIFDEEATEEAIFLGHAKGNSVAVEIPEGTMITVRVRRSGMMPFEQQGITAKKDLTVTAIRTPDNLFHSDREPLRISVDWDSSPRQVYMIDNDHGQARIEHVHKAIRMIEASLEGIQHPALIYSCGGEDLGDGCKVGVTMIGYDTDLNFAVTHGNFVKEI